MPRGDRTGPWGEGPMTGRAAGFCAGYRTPGYRDSYMPGQGPGIRRGFRFFNPFYWFGRGRGMGYGRGPRRGRGRW